MDKAISAVLEAKDALQKLGVAEPTIDQLTQMVSISQGLAQPVEDVSDKTSGEPVAPIPVFAPVAGTGKRLAEDTRDAFIQTATGVGQLSVTLAELSVFMLHDYNVFKCKDIDTALDKLTVEVLKCTDIPATGQVRGKEVNFRAAGKPDGKITSKFSLASWDATNSIWQNWDRSLRIYFHEKSKTTHDDAYAMLFTHKGYSVPVRTLAKMVKDRGLAVRQASSKTAMQKSDQRVAMICPQLEDLAKGCSKKVAGDYLAILKIAVKTIEDRLA